jgi:murein L,D-transpeptidase YafK
MRVAYRRAWLGIRVFALIGLGGLVAHLAAVSVAPREHHAQAAAPSDKASTGSVASAAASTEIPLPGASMDREQRLAAKGMRAGNPVMIRIFKAESQLEVWLQKEDRFELFAAYPICYWSGRLGPKQYEGDKQAPEGLYSVTIGQIHHKGRWPRSLDIGFPNLFDKAYARTGSLILVHGGCKSTGCYAMTNPVMDEIYGLSEQALRQGQDAIPVHIFPFRMTEENMVSQAGNPWTPFWLNIKQAYDLFERTRVPPKVSVCNKRYSVTDGETASSPCIDDGSDGIPMPVVEASAVSKKVIKARKVASKTHTRRVGGRNARKAYAEARRARMAEHARRMRTSDAGPRRRSH